MPKEGIVMKTTLRSGFQEWESLWEYIPGDDGPAFVRRGYSFPNTWEGDPDGTQEVDTPEGCFAIVFHGARGHTVKFFNESGDIEKRAFIRGMLEGMLSVL